VRLLRWSPIFALVGVALIWFASGNSHRPFLHIHEGVGAGLVLALGVTAWYSLAYGLLRLRRHLREAPNRRAVWASAVAGLAILASMPEPYTLALPGLLVASAASQARIALLLPHRDRCVPGAWDPDDRDAAVLRQAVWGAIAPDGRVVIVARQQDPGGWFGLAEERVDLTVAGFLPNGALDPSLARGTIGCLDGVRVDRAMLAGDRVALFAGGQLHGWAGLDGRAGAPAAVAAARAALTEAGDPFATFRAAASGRVLRARRSVEFATVDLTEEPPRLLRAFAPAPAVVRAAAELGDRLAVVLEGREELTSLDALEPRLVALGATDVGALALAVPVGLASELAPYVFSIEGIFPLDAERVLVEVEARGVRGARHFLFAAAARGASVPRLSLETHGPVAALQRLADGRLAVRLKRDRGSVLFVPDAGSHDLEPPRGRYEGWRLIWGAVALCGGYDDVLAVTDDGKFLRASSHGLELYGRDCEPSPFSVPPIVGEPEGVRGGDDRSMGLWP